MPALRNTIHLAAPIDRVWALVGDPTRAADWIPGITNVDVRDARRICTFADGTVQHERIAGLDPATHSYSYTIESGPLPLKSNRGRIELRPKGAGTTLQWDAELEAADPAAEAGLVQMLDGMYKQVLEGLRPKLEASAAALA
jgi:carbon monoxide dehydrogenase subunit G